MQPVIESFPTVPRPDSHDDPKVGEEGKTAGLTPLRRLPGRDGVLRPGGPGGASDRIILDLA